MHKSADEPRSPRLPALKAATTRAHLAELLGFTHSGLAYLVYRLSPEQKYKTFEIPKRGGGVRLIKAPSAQLKLLQRRLSDLLQDCAEEIAIANSYPDKLAHGFRRKRSTFTNGRVHRGRRFVFNIDLQNFFPTINFGRVRGYFLVNQHFALTPLIATTIAQIACDGVALPQGAPSSPVISNLITHLLDIRLAQLASSVRCSYSRYADDVTFSTNERRFPPEIAETAAAGVWTAGTRLRQVIQREGFEINENKTRMMYRQSRQTVTGMVVNTRISLPTEYRRRARAMVSSLTTTGAFTTKPNTPDPPGSTTLDTLHGILGYIHRVDDYNRKSFKNENVGIGNDAVYRKFLMYRLFYDAERPLVLCEGPTDNVYLRLAIKRLASDFPLLASVTPKGVELKIRLLKYSGSSTARVLGLNDGGAKILANFIRNYDTNTSFNAPGLTHPVIVVYDSDRGGDDVIGAMKKYKVKAERGHGAIRITKNLYAVAVPLKGSEAEATIEDLFEPSLRTTLLDGKRFDPKCQPDKDNCYGKRIFADSVVAANWQTVNFQGFSPLLTAVESAIHMHSTPSGTTKPTPPAPWSA